MRWYQKFNVKSKAAIAGWKGQGYDFANWFGRTFWGIDNSQLATNENIFSVVTRISNTMASLPLKLQQKHKTIYNDVIDLLVNEPNPNMSGYELIQKMETSRNETGNAYVLIQRDIRFQPEALIPLDFNYVTPFINSDDGALWYKVQAENGTYYIHNGNMLHVKHITDASRWSGISPIEVLKNTLKYDKAVQEFSLSEMEKKESFILKYGANVKKEIRDSIIADFKRFYAENGGILFQEPGVEVDEIQRKYVASDTLASERITRSRVANVFNIPVSFLNDNEGSSYGSNEQMMLQFVTMTLTPIVKQFEKEFNRKLLTKDDRKNGMEFKFNLGGLLRGDTAARTAFYQAMLRSGGMTPNEVREKEDLPPMIGNAEKLHISGDLYPIDMNPTQRKSTSSTEGGEKNDQTEKE
ncbi:phage portal protein [Viridibacillus sp. FSL R5-0468]|uniref:phage portal protein n=1 Tax=Viridibacillus sp. FSL R5-0468 TaxID=2921640 RepID=UPI0030F4D74C